MTRFFRFSLLGFMFLSLAACSVSHEYPSNAKSTYYQDGVVQNSYESGREAPAWEEEEDPSICVGPWCSCESY